MSNYDDKLRELNNYDEIESDLGSKDQINNNSDKNKTVVDEEDDKNINLDMDTDVDDIHESDLVSSKDIQFVLDTMSKQAPYDKIQIKQIFLWNM